MNNRSVLASAFLVTRLETLGRGSHSPAARPRASGTRTLALSPSANAEFDLSLAADQGAPPGQFDQAIQPDTMARSCRGLRDTGGPEGHG